MSPDRTFLRASSCSPLLIATAVWDALCGSTPMITAMEPPRSRLSGTAEGTPASGWSCAFLFRATPRRDPRRTLFVRKPGQQRRPAGTSRANPQRTSQRYESTQRLPDSLKQAHRGRPRLEVRDGSCGWWSCRSLCAVVVEHLAGGCGLVVVPVVAAPVVVVDEPGVGFELAGPQARCSRGAS